MTPPVHDVQRPASWPVAAAFPLTTGACLATVVVLEIRLRDRPVLWSFGEGAVTSYGVGTATVGFLIAVMAAVILRSPGHRVIGTAMGGVGLFWALDGLAEGWVALGLATADPLAGMTLATWFLFRFTALLTASIVLLPLLFPDGRFVPGRWGVASWVCMVVTVVVALSYNVVPWDEHLDVPIDPPPGVDLDPTTIDALAPIAAELTGTLSAVTLIGLIVPVGVVVHRYRRSTGTARDQMRWLWWGALVAVICVAVTIATGAGALSNLVFFVCITIVPAAMTVAVVNPRIVPIEDLLGRTLVLAVLAVVLVVVDFAVVAAISALLDDSMEQSQVVLVVLLTTVLCYGPLRQRLSRAVQRRVFGDRANPYDAVAGLASTLEDLDEGEEQLAAVARAVAAAFGVRFVSVEVDRHGGGRLVTTYGERPGATRTLPISYRDAEVGRLVLPARGLRSRLSRRDEELLGDLVRQAATAARTGRLAEELQESRERLVTAREEERRRIRRDLHDGLGPALSGVVFRLESARLLVGRDPDAASLQIGAASADVQGVVADVRRLVHDLRPPALDDLGLVGALRQQAEVLGRSGLAVEVRAAELPPLSAAVEVAAYRIVAEALTNVARHACARTATVTLDVSDQALVVSIADDGDGIAPDVSAGVGLVGMRERAAELGGHSEVTCPPAGGTLVRARLPMRSAT